MPVLTGSVHTHILTKPSRAGFTVIRLELIEPGVETCVYQAKACSPTDQPVRKFKDGLGINMTMKTFIIRAKRVSNCYIQKRKSARVRVCSTNLGFSVEKSVLVLVWGTYYVPHTYVPGTSERFVANCGVGPSTRGQGDSASLVKPTQDQ